MLTSSVWSWKGWEIWQAALFRDPYPWPHPFVQDYLGLRVTEMRKRAMTLTLKSLTVVNWASVGCCKWNRLQMFLHCSHQLCFLTGEEAVETLLSTDQRLSLPSSIVTVYYTVSQVLLFVLSFIYLSFFYILGLIILKRFCSFYWFLFQQRILTFYFLCF